MIVSIVIPVFNAERYLQSCLESLRSQHGTDFEVILVNDGSTDNSAAICENFVDRRISVRVIHQTNMGALAARIAGAEAASGTYVMFVDADDLLHPDAVQTVSGIAQAFNPDLISFGYSLQEDFSTNDDRSGLDEGYLSDASYTLVKRAVCGGDFNFLWQKVVRRPLLLRPTSRGSYHERMSFSEDWFESLRLVDEARSLYHTNEILYYYRHNEASTTHQYSASHIAQLAKTFDRLMSYVGTWGFEFVEIAQFAELRNSFALAILLRSSDKGYRDRVENYTQLRAITQVPHAPSRVRTARDIYRLFVFWLLSHRIYLVADGLLYSYGILHKLRSTLKRNRSRPLALVTGLYVPLKGSYAHLYHALRSKEH